MKRHRRTAILAALAIATFVSAPVALAQKSIESHPAAQVVMSYLRYAMSQEWRKSVALLEPESVEDLKLRYIERIKRAPTIDEEIAMVRKLDKNNLKEVQAMKTIDFYIAYHKGVQDRFEVTEEILNQIKTTMRAKLLSIGEETIEGTDYAHILVRTKHENRDKEVSSLDLVSLIKIDGKWKVTLRAQRPLIGPAPKKG